MIFRLLFLLAAFGAGYLYGKNQATIKTVIANKDRIEGAGEIISGFDKVFAR